MAIHKFYIKCHGSGFVWIIKRSTRKSPAIEYCISLDGKSYDYKDRVVSYNCRNEIPQYIWKQVVKQCL